MSKNIALNDQTDSSRIRFRLAADDPAPAQPSLQTQEIGAGQSPIFLQGLSTGVMDQDDTSIPDPLPTNGPTSTGFFVNPYLANPLPKIMVKFISETDWTSFKAKFDAQLQDIEKPDPPFGSIKLFDYLKAYADQNAQDSATAMYGVFASPNQQAKVFHTDLTAKNESISAAITNFNALVNAAARVSPAIQFPPLHVEPLLDQAQDLLSRALQDRQLYYDASAKGFQIGLELEEFIRSDYLHAKEQIDGSDVIAETRALRDFKGEQLSFNANNEARSALVFLESFLANNADSAAAYKGLSNFLGAVPYLTPTGNPAPKPLAYNAFAPTAGPQGGTVLPVSAGTKAAQLQGIGTFLGQIDNQTAAGTVHAQRYQTSSACGASFQKTLRFKAEVEWVRKDYVHRTRRANSSRDLFLKKRSGVLADGGPLNFAQQRDQAATRYRSNFTKALQRITAVADAFAKLYPISGGVPKFSAATTDGNQYLDAVWLWLQDAIDVVHRTNRFEQNSIVQLSLKQLVGDAAWSAGSASGAWTFQLPVTAFDGLFCVRLRGISTHVVGQNTDGAWRVRLTPPANNIYEMADGSMVTIDNPASKPVSYGRVLTWDPLRPADVFGIVALHNVSPLGSWTASFDPLSTLGRNRSSIGDVLLELHLVARVAAAA